jgi:hypothetical protein
MSKHEKNFHINMLPEAFNFLVTAERIHHQQFSTNVWARIVGN